MNKILHGSLVIAVIIGLNGCGPKPDMNLKVKSGELLQKDPRFSVERTGIFEDDLAYDGKRGIYIIKDNKTGKEFVGVSGVGISELGSHNVDDKTVVDDER
jgi:hypothetical protein